MSLAGFAGRRRQLGGARGITGAATDLPLGAGTSFSTDRVALQAATSVLEPLTGGSAPVFDAMQTALAVTAANAPPGNRAVVGAIPRLGFYRLCLRRRAEESLARPRRTLDPTGIQRDADLRRAWRATQRTSGSRHNLSAALRAPAVSLGVDYDSNDLSGWAAGSFAALDLAADLIDGFPLPALSAVFHVKADEPFAAGALLYGAVYVESENCPMGCSEIPLEFAVEIP